MEKKRNLKDKNYLRAKYRWEFLKRNEKFQSALMIKYDSRERESWEAIPYFVEEFGLEWRIREVEAAQEAMLDKQKEEFFLQHTRGIRESAISLIVIEKHGLSSADEKEIDFSELETLKYYGKDNPWSWTYEKINPEDNSIIVKIKLDKGNDLIVDEIRYLLTLLDEERLHFEVFQKKPKVKPRWDVYDHYIEVYDLRETAPRPSWAKIAKKIFPEDKSDSSRVRKVRHYYDQAKRMINGDWIHI